MKQNIDLIVVNGMPSASVLTVFGRVYFAQQKREIERVIVYD